MTDYAGAFNLLVDAYNLIRGGHWCKLAYAMDRDGERYRVNEIPVDRVDDMRYCPLGAVYRAQFLRTSDPKGQDATDTARHALAEQARIRMGEATPMSWNDTVCRTEAEALRFVADAACDMYEADMQIGLDIRRMRGAA